MSSVNTSSNYPANLFSQSTCVSSEGDSKAKVVEKSSLIKSAASNSFFDVQSLLFSPSLPYRSQLAHQIGLVTLILPRELNAIITDYGDYYCPEFVNQQDEKSGWTALHATINSHILENDKADGNLRQLCDRIDMVSLLVDAGASSSISIPIASTERDGDIFGTNTATTLSHAKEKQADHRIIALLSNARGNQSVNIIVTVANTVSAVLSKITGLFEG